MADQDEIAQVELVGSEFNPRAKAETEAKSDETEAKTKGVGGRLRAAAGRAPDAGGAGVTGCGSDAANMTTRAVKDGDGGYAYFDTEGDFGVVLEAIEIPARRREPDFVWPR